MNILFLFCEKVLICLIKSIVNRFRKNFLRKASCNANQVVMDPGLKDNNQDLALSFKVKGKGFNLVISLGHDWSKNVS